MPDKRIEIVEDVNDIVTFDEIVRDTVSRSDVLKAEERIETLKAEIAERNVEIEQLEKEIARAKQIIAIADEKKALELEKEALIAEIQEGTL